MEMKQKRLIMKESLVSKMGTLRFRILGEEDSEQAFDLIKEQTIVGKSKNCDLVLDDERILDYEILFSKSKDGRYFIKPLHSYEDLLINGKKDLKVCLEEGDLVTFGTIEGVLEKRYDEIENLITNEKKSEKLSKENQSIIENNEIENIFIERSEQLEVNLKNPLEDLGFNFFDVFKDNKYNKNEENFKNFPFKKPCLKVEIYSSGNLIYDEIKDIKNGELKITGKENDDIKNLVVPFLEGEDEYPFIKEVDQEKIMVRGLPELKTFKEKEKEGNQLFSLTDWKPIDKGEKVVFVKGPNHLIIEVINEEVKLKKIKLFNFTKKDYKIFFYSFFFVFILFILSFLFWKIKKRTK